MKRIILKKNGVTLTALVSLIIIMGIITGTVVVSFNNIYITTKKKEFANELYTIQKMAEEYKFKNGKYPIKDTGTNEIDLYELGVNEVKQGLRKDGDADDIYTIDDTTGKIRYKKGVKIGGTSYYQLEDNLQLDNLKLEKGDAE